MGVHILCERYGDSDLEHAVLWCSTSMWAFGPVFSGSDARAAALDFLQCRFPGSRDPRRLKDPELEREYSLWASYRDPERREDCPASVVWPVWEAEDEARHEEAMRQEEEEDARHG